MDTFVLYRLFFKKQDNLFINYKNSLKRITTGSQNHLIYIDLVFVLTIQ